MNTIIKKIGIIGSGIMGSGIGQVFASKGFRVFLNDVDGKRSEKALESITKNIRKMCEKGRCNSDEAKSWISSVSVAKDLESFDGVDFVVEAIVENEDAKKSLFEKLDKITPKNVILATNTSSISVTTLGLATSRPDKVVGMHFMNPAPLISGVEVIKGLATSEATLEVVYSLINRLEKTSITANDKPGFVVNRILIPMLNEAMCTLQEGVSSKEEIDNGMKLCCNMPIGPLALADMIGLDTVMAILNTLYKGYGDEKYKPCTLLKEFVEAGRVGKKGGKGIYEYQ